MFFSKLSLGIVINQRKVRIALLKKEKAKIVISDLQEMNLDGSTLHEILQNINKKIKKSIHFPIFQSLFQTMSVAQSLVAIKHFPLMLDLSESEEFHYVGEQLSENLGLPISQLLFDYYLLSDKEEIEAYACRLSLVEEKLITLNQTGFKLSALELETQSLLRLFQQQFDQQENKTALFIDIQEEQAQFYYIENFQLQFYREIVLPKIQEIEKENLEKQEFTLLLSQALLGQINQIESDLINQKNVDLFLFGENVEKVVASKLAENLERNVKMFDPFLGLTVEKSINTDNNKSQWVTVIGLALRGIKNAEH